MTKSAKKTNLGHIERKPHKFRPVATAIVFLRTSPAESLCSPHANEASRALPLQLESHLIDAVPSNSPSGVLVIRVATEFATGRISDLNELAPVLEQLAHHIRPTQAPPTRTIFAARDVPEVPRTLLDGFFVPAEMLRDVVRGLRENRNICDVVTFPDAESKKTWYADTQGVNATDLAYCIERTFGHIVEGMTEEKRDDLKQIVGRSIHGMENDLVAARNSLVQLGHEFRLAIAMALEPILNRYILQHSQVTLEDKTELTRMVSSTLKELGLAIKCPITGFPAIASADSRKNESANSRIVLDAKQPDGGRRRSFSAPTLPQIELIEDAPRREALSEWATRLRQAKESQPRHGEKGAER